MTVIQKKSQTSPRRQPTARPLVGRLVDLHDQATKCAAYSELVWDLDAGHGDFMSDAHAAIIRLLLMQTLVETLDAMTRALAALLDDPRVRTFRDDLPVPLAGEPTPHPNL